MRQDLNNSVTLVLPDCLSNEIDAIARLPVETAGVLLASIVTTPEGDTRILGRRIRWVADSAYIRRGGDHLSIASEGYVPHLAEAEALGAAAIWLHTHPGIDSSPRPSEHDEEVDRQISDLFRLRAGSPYYSAVIFSPRRQGLAFTGWLQSENAPRLKIERQWTVGDRFSLTQAFDRPPMDIQPIFDRSVRAFGGAVQQALGELRVGIVGCGGTGSVVAEQLVRLGVRWFTLFDPDHLSRSNVTRVYGSTPADVGKLKVDILAAHLMRIASACSHGPGSLATPRTSACFQQSGLPDTARALDQSCSEMNSVQTQLVNVLREVAHPDIGVIAKVRSANDSLLRSMTTRAQQMDDFLVRLEKQVWAIWLPVVASAALALGFALGTWFAHVRQGTPEALSAAQAQQMPMPEAPAQQAVPQRNAKHH